MLLITKDQHTKELLSMLLADNTTTNKAMYAEVMTKKTHLSESGNIFSIAEQKVSVKYICTAESSEQKVALSKRSTHQPR